MALIKPPVQNIWCDTGDKSDIPTPSELSAGWPLAAIPPSRQRFNWILNYVANGVRYFTRRGLVDYDSGETYLIGDRCTGPDNKTYVSLQNNNLNHTPASSPTWWKLWALSANDISHGGNCPVTGPASAPTDANPFTRYTSVSPNFEEWQWNGTAWQVIGNFYKSQTTHANTTVSSTAITPRSLTATRNGVIRCIGSASYLSTGTNQVLASYILKNGVIFAGSNANSGASAQGVFANSCAEVPVVVGDVITWQFTSTASLTTLHIMTSFCHL